ncbi:hypothetical protein [Streptomyces mirabilis]|uniref:hypothetical protein n=1 Tax=Streptomyces mirabilis TaxID=68239 RepID=UPI00342667CA
MQWQQRLIGGYGVASQISSSLPDQVLAEVVQHRIRTLTEAEQRRLGMFTHHQGSHSTDALSRADGFLIGAGYLTATPAAASSADAASEVPSGEGWDASVLLGATGLGVLTMRLMVSATVGYELRSAVGRATLSRDADGAERLVIVLLSGIVPKLARAALPENLKPAVAAVEGRLSQVVDPSAPGGMSGVDVTYTRGALARAALLAVAKSPGAFAGRGREVAGIPYASLNPLLEEAPRYLHWRGSQAFLGTLHPWCAIASADLRCRVRPLPLCAAPRQRPPAVDVRADGHTRARRPRCDRHVAGGPCPPPGGPEWTTPTPPRGCRLDSAAYAGLLRERITNAEQLAARDDGVVTDLFSGRALPIWTGGAYRSAVTHHEAALPYPQAPSREHNADRHTQLGAAVFS